VTSTVVCCTSVVVETRVVVETTVVTGSGVCGATVVGGVPTTGTDVEAGVDTVVTGGCCAVPAVAGFVPTVDGAVATTLCVTDVPLSGEEVPVLRLPAPVDDREVEDPDARAAGLPAELLAGVPEAVEPLDLVGRCPGVATWRLLETFACSVVRVASSCCFPSASATWST
jgi:hypothetical protein